MSDLAKLVERADLTDLARLVDGLADSRDWEQVIELRDLCREAVTRGRQLWGVAHWCTYRIALGAPADLAAATVLEPRSAVLPGPISEVLGVRHTWAALAPHLPEVPERSVVAHERGIRGEALPEGAVDLSVVEVPPILQPWEGEYPVVEYGPSGGTFEPPALPALDAVDLPGAPPVDLERDLASSALLDLAKTWMVESAGRAETRCVEGDAAGAIAAFGLRRARMAEVPVGDALDWMAWLGASGGAYGVRKGGAAGRASAWWTLALLTGTDDHWPPDPDELGAAATELRWFVWTDLAPDTGWACRLAVEDPLDGLAWALMAVDSR